MINAMKAMKINVTRITDLWDNKAGDIVDGLLEWLPDTDIKEKDRWVELLTPPERAPAQGSDIKHAEPVSHAAHARIKIQLPKFSGGRGECAAWWSQIQRTLVTMQVPPSNLFALVVDALEGDALAEFWHVYQEREQERRGSGLDVDAIMAVLVELFDAGQHVLLLKKWRQLEQRKGETVLKFRARYMRVLDALAQYDWKLTEEQVVADFGHRLMDWARIATHQPANMHGILRAVAELGESAEVVPKPQLLTVGGDYKQKCWNCGGQHKSKDCSKPRAPRKCFRCKSEQHLIADCDQPDTRERERKSATNRV